MRVCEHTTVAELSCGPCVMDGHDVRVDHLLPALYYPNVILIRQTKSYRG